MDYNVNQITNSSNQIVEIEGYYSAKAIGAGFHNGFGFDLGVEGDVNYRRYVALGVLTFNLKKLEKKLIHQNKKKKPQARAA